MKSLLFILVVVAYVANGEALKCYFCTSNSAKGCNDPFNRTDAGVVEQECTANSRCSKIVVSINSVNYTTRNCFTTPGADGNLNRAVETPLTTMLCDTDLCNGASSLTATTVLLTAMSLVGLLALKN